MANQWLRLWHDMPTDPKWKTIARVSGQPISLVQSVYLHLLVDASRNVTRGHATVTHEDLASALDVTEEAIGLIWDAMQGRVLDGNYLTGWDKRQVKREDATEGESAAKSAAQRKREQRERQRQSHEVTQCHAMSRNVTPDKEEIREDKGEGKPSPAHRAKTDIDLSAWHDRPSPQVFADWKAMRKAKRAPVSQTVINQFATEINKAVLGGYTADACLSLCILKGWQGFKFDWLKNEEANNANNQRNTGASRSDRNTQAHRDYIAELERQAEVEAGGCLADFAQPAIGH